jgi:hypothetical protein
VIAYSQDYITTTKTPGTNNSLTLEILKINALNYTFFLALSSQ